MDWTPTHLPYRQTGYFSKIITDYLERAGSLAPFYTHPVSTEGIEASLRARKQSPVNREVLVTALKEQYSILDAAVPVGGGSFAKVVRGSLPAGASGDDSDSGSWGDFPVRQNIDRLLQDNTFTICTAHQPAIFTGPLYFIYKIIHTIKLADELAKKYPQNQFVPVFYMGSEDADLEELGKIYLDQEKLVWDTKQTGAVGRMRTKGLEKILNRVAGELSVQPYGGELVHRMKEIYLGSPDIQTATFRLLHYLFAEYGLVVLIPDNASLKKLMIPVFEDDLFQGVPTRVVNETIDRLSQHYKVQANPRPINLFYLKDDLRGRIERVGDVFKVHDSMLEFSQQEIRQELDSHPERFSPNVILRGLFQESILPNIAFIGGGGETAYWLELKDLFTHYKVPFPMLILRNSFLLVETDWKEKLERAGLEMTELFKSAEILVNELVKRESQQQLSLSEEITTANLYYEKLKTLVRAVDLTLVQHVEALQKKAMGPLQGLEKKLLKAEKRKFVDQQRQIHALKSALFPLKGLQERIDNFMPWYAARGQQFIKDLYRYSLTLEQEFVVLAEEG
ncbi:MAG TPA: bacillithiol biosynthesis cysteine-adding enzyme BshC [Puia sp.]|nr:bacillithiol biosynthesis cysteine-adding enzyme BshC [Puia sp.]